LADFIVDWTPSSQDIATTSQKVIWTIFCDGSWESFEAGAVVVIISLSKVKTSYTVKLQFQCTNNATAYEALLLGLEKLKAMGVKRETLKSDS
jgi:ribonuclease HI